MATDSTGCAGIDKVFEVHFTMNNKLKDDRSADTLSLGSIDIFCKAAELQSFTNAAQALGVTPAAVSRSVGRLEQRLGAQLFVRTTRLVRLTDAGREFHEQCRQALAQIADAARVAAGQKQGASGLVRVSVPTTYAYCRLLPALPRFAQAYPEVRLEIDISGRNVDFVEDQFDVAIRLGVHRDSRLVVRRLEHAELGVFASPDYLARRGTPAVVDDLRGHDCIGFVMSGNNRLMPWFFRVDGADVERQVAGPFRLRQDPLAMVRLALAGGGLCQTFGYIVEDDVAQGRLVEVLADCRGGPRPISVLYLHSPHLPARVRAFVDFVIDTLGGPGLPGRAAGR